MRTEEKPMIARDELAARCLVSLLTRDGYDGDGAARDAVVAADALLSALAVPPAAPAPSPTSYVPKVGDVVTWGARECLYRVDDDGVLRPCDKRVKCALAVTMTDVAVRGIDLSPASASERAAAGLPVDEATTPPAATPAYPVDAAGRPLWVRFTGKWAINSVTPRKVESWPTDSTPRVRSLVDPQRLITLPPDEWEPCAAPAETPAAALTEEEREELADKIREDRWQMSWDDIGAAARAYWLDRADAAAAWFAKRGGAK